MMITKTFEYKGQMINYYNKVRKNPKVELASCCFSAIHGSYIVQYSYFSTFAGSSKVK